MDEPPPSYLVATRGAILEDGNNAYADVIGLLVQYVDPHDYYNLCLVSKGVYALFSPLLVKNPIRMIQTLNLRPGNGRWSPRVTFILSLHTIF